MRDEGLRGAAAALAGAAVDDPTPSNDPLLDRARTGDADALEELIRRHERAIGERIRRLLPPALMRRLGVSDILQETRLTAHARIGALENRGDAAFRNWLYAIADRKARRAVQRHRDVRMRSFAREVTQGGRTPGVPSGARSPSVIASAREDVAAVRRTLDALSPDTREVLRLCCAEGLSIREAAARMDRSYDATKKLYARALARFARVHREREGPGREP